MGRAQLLALAHQQAPGAVGEEHPLVRIEGERVGPLDAVQARLPFLAQHERAPVGGVDVQPQLARGAQIGERPQRIDGAGVGGAGRGDHQERRLAARPILVDGGGERLGPQPEALVDLDEAQVAGGMPARRIALPTLWWAWPRCRRWRAGSRRRRRSGRAGPHHRARGRQRAPGVSSPRACGP
jgi:hypothetical protein